MIFQFSDTDDTRVDRMAAAELMELTSDTFFSSPHCL